MCGIAGVLDRNAALNGSEIDRRVSAMVATLYHRGPDDGGHWSDPPAGIGLGMRRLAVIDTSPAGHQPMTSSCGRYVMVYNGEVYNHRDLARTLAVQGRHVQGGSDTAVLLEACAAWGIEAALERAVGMFAFALYDRRDRALMLVRDRLGIKPLYWAREGEVFVFGSELKALEAAGVLNLEIDPASLAAFLRFAYVPAPASIYKGVHKLSPGHILTIPNVGEPRLTCYWDLETIARDGQAAPSAEALENLEELLKDAVKQRLVADVPLGALLSGGIDSSIVVALMQAQSTERIRTFSIGFHESGYDESKHAAAVAEHLGTDHTELFVTPREALDSIAELPRWFDEPFADSSQIPTLLLSRLTRKHVTVALSGDGGDEVFAGYNRYTWLPRIRNRVNAWPGSMRTGLSGLLRGLSPRTWDVLGAILPARHRPRQLGEKLWKTAAVIAAQNLDEAYCSVVSHWPDPAQLVGTTAGTNWPGADRFLTNALNDPVARMQLTDMATYLPDDILTKVDRASMAASLEVRVPLLDHRVVELAWTLPRSVLLANGESKAPLRRILDRYVPRHLIDRPKSGFGAPIDTWLRGPLRDWAEDLLSTTALAADGFIDPIPVQTTWAEHLSGRRNHQHALWCVLMFQAWRRR